MLSFTTFCLSRKSNNQNELHSSLRQDEVKTVKKRHGERKWFHDVNVSALHVLIAFTGFFISIFFITSSEPATLWCLPPPGACYLQVSATGSP